MTRAEDLFRTNFIRLNDFLPKTNFDFTRFSPIRTNLSRMGGTILPDFMSLLMPPAVTPALPVMNLPQAQPSSVGLIRGDFGRIAPLPEFITNPSPQITGRPPEMLEERIPRVREEGRDLITPIRQEEGRDLITPIESEEITGQKIVKKDDIEKQQNLIEEAKKYKSAEEFVKSRSSKGYVTVYHRTNVKPDEILKSGFKSLENTDEVFLSNKKKGQAVGYGENVIELRVKKSDLRLDDEFPDGEKHYALSSKKAAQYLQDQSQLTSIWEKAHTKNK